LLAWTGEQLEALSPCGRGWGEGGIADKKITLDLDDGVKVNYGKFGDLLAEVKNVTGGREEEG
jgi:hypothetical protein